MKIWPGRSESCGRNPLPGLSARRNAKNAAIR
jgi:hypothetical protein